MSAVALGGNSWYKSASTGANNACERYIVWLTPAYRHSRCPYKRFGAACTTNVLYVCSHWAGSTLLGTSWGHLVRAYRLEPSVSPRTYHQNGIKIFRKLVGLLSISWWPPATPCLMASRSHSPVTVNFFLGIPVLSLSLCVWGGGVVSVCLFLSWLRSKISLRLSLALSCPLPSVSIYQFLVQPLFIGSSRPSIPFLWGEGFAGCHSVQALVTPIVVSYLSLCRGLTCS